MKLISTRAHGAFDYLMGTFLLLSPWSFDFANFDIAQNIPIVIGLSMIVYSVFTSYEFGAVAIMSMRAHLMFDLTGGLFLMASPWLYDFADYVFIPHLAFGLSMIGASLCSETESQPTRSVIQPN